MLEKTKDKTLITKLKELELNKNQLDLFEQLIGDETTSET
jgi:hypothetical protein